jgi:hypothetical protein
VPLPVHSGTYETLERASPFLIVWIALFTLVNIVRIARQRPGPAAREGMIASELPGLPLMLLHSVGFVLSILSRDLASSLLFLWWGPGYVFVASTLLVRARRRSPPIRWKPFARVTSWLCKLSYVAFMAVYCSLGLYGIPFVFSAWIIQDQVKLTWLRQNADRTRRVSEDLWIPRILYAALLGLPFVAEVPLRPFAAGLGVLLLGLWVAGLARVVRAGRFRDRPDPRASDNLRDIVYLNERPY